MRLRVLISAHELSPAQGSECAVGWNVATRIAKYHDVTVLYASGTYLHKNLYKNAVDGYIRTKGEIPGLTLINIDQPKITVKLGKFNELFSKLGPTGLPPIYYLGYNAWERRCYKKAKELHRITPFHVTHHLTQIAFREPGYLWKLEPPFFWGPTGGATVLPKKIYRSLPLKFKVLEKFRKISNYFSLNLSGQVKMAVKRASKIYSYTHYDAKILQKKTNLNVEVLVESGTTPQSKADVTPPGKKLKLLWCGRITPYKAPEILLQALGKLEVLRKNIHLTVIGDGILKDDMRVLAENVGVKDITWIREVPHSQVFSLMKEADIFIHTSIREGTPNVIMEALANGLPVICHDAFGMSIAINDKCGIKIPFNSPEESIKGFSEAIERLLLNPLLLNKLKDGARERAVQLSWDYLAEKISRDYLSLHVNAY